MPASFIIDRAPVAAGLSQPMSHHNSVVFQHHSHEARTASGCAMSSRQSNGGTSSQFALQELVNFAAANLNLTSSAMSSADTDGIASTSPVLGRSVSACSPSSSASSSSGSMGPMAADGPVSGGSVHGGSGGSSNRKSANMTECVPVPSSEHVAEIVGRQGSKIKALRNKTNTYIKTPVRGEEPVFVVTGRREDVAAAKREILSASEHFSQIRASRLGTSSGSIPQTSSVVSSVCPSRPVSTTAAIPTNDIPGQVTIQVRVPYRVVGLVVGPKGATIKRIQQDSSTYIVTPSRDREPVFEVTGTPEGVEKARQDIASYIAQRTGSTSEPETENHGGPNSDFVDGRMLFGSVLKMGPSPNMNNNNLDTLTLMTSYNNALNHIGPGRMMTSSDYDVHQQGSVGSNDNEARFANTMMLRAALEQSMISSPKNDVNNETSSVWPTGGATDQILRSLMSLFPGDDDHLSPGGSGKCGMLSVALPPYDDQSTRGGGCDVPHHEYSPANPMDMAFHMQQQFATCPRGGSSGSVGDSSMSSASPTDSTSDALHRMVLIGPSGYPSGSLPTGCCLCSEAPVTSALVPCGHNLFCKNCADNIVYRPERDDRRCPVCGEKASLAIRILS